MPFGAEIHLIGNLHQIGSWDVSKSVKMHWSPGHLWKISLSLSKEEIVNIEYKFI